jgi:hypothetical protein
MGVIDLPRAMFQGFMAWNPSTMNNNDQQPTYDATTATLNWSWLERHGLRDETDFDRYVTTIDVVPTANDVINVGVDTTAPPAEWNFYGDNTCGFVQPDWPKLEWPAKFTKPAGGTTITGFVNQAAKRITSGDPWIGLPLQLNLGLDAAKLVDVDPIAPWSSQLFVDTVTLGSPDGTTGFTGATAGRAHSRWVSFCRNQNPDGTVIIAGIGSAMWQLALPTRDLRILDQEPAAGSLARLLKDALERPGVNGLLVRFVTYDTTYFWGPEFSHGTNPDWPGIAALYTAYREAQEAYEAGDTATRPPVPMNRAYSKTVGWLAPWTDADMRSAATGRILYSPNGTCMPPPAQWPLGPAAVEVATDPKSGKVTRLAVDLGSTIAETGPKLAKADYGDLTLALAADTTNPVTVIAKIPYSAGDNLVAYDRAAYEAGAGVVDLLAPKLTATDLDRQLVILHAGPTADAAPVVALEEAEYTAETEERGTYVNEPGAAWSTPDPAITIQVRRRGGRPPAGTQLRIAQYAPWPPMFNEMAWSLVSDDPAVLDQPRPFAVMDAGAAKVRHGAWVTVPVSVADDVLPYGTATVALRGLRPGPSLLQFTPGPVAITSPEPAKAIGFFDLVGQLFANVRILPYHNAMAASYINWLKGGPSVDLATQRAWDGVFRTFALMYPAMRFLRDPLQFQAQRGRILAVTDPALFERASYMPVTRPLSAGQRAMLVAWSDYLDGTLATKKQEAPRGRRG